MRTMKLGTKIIVGFIAVSVITLVLGIIGFYGAMQSEEHIHEVGAVRLPSVDSLLAIKAGAENIRGTLRTLAIPGLSREMRERQYNNIETARKVYQEAWKVYEPLPQTPEEAQLWKQFVPAWEAWRKENNTFMEMARQFDANGIEDPMELARQIERFTKDHYALVQRTLHLLYMNEAVFEGGDDHTACNAGRYFPNFRTNSENFRNLIREFAVPHQQFHEAVAKIKAKVEARDIAWARDIYLKEMIPAMAEVFQSFDHMLAVANESADLLAKSRDHLLGPVTETQRAAIGLLDKIVAINRDVAVEQVKDASAQATLLEFFSLIATIVGVILAILLGVLITRSITKPINRIIEALASGADQVSSASGQVSSASQSLAEGASEQAAAIEETSSSLEEMSSMTKQNAENAAQADSLMREAKSVVSKAGASMKQMNESMNEISSAGQEIGKIIKTIDEIAFQTNLLALNAAVEAARAGEAGAGFAVVADEVRNLAQRAADAAKNTANLIEGTIVRINQGTELVRTTDEAFTEVAGSSNKVAELIGEIAAASAEQAQGIDQVNQAVTQMDQVTQNNAANAEESASASEELNAQAESMMEVVGELLILVSGSAATTMSHSIRQAQKTSPSTHKALPGGY
jgi:methyl-accepting chemotaxis protein